MTHSEMKEKAAESMRKLLAESELPDPDIVEHCDDCVRLWWSRSETGMIVEIEDYEEAEEDPEDDLLRALPPFS